MHGFYSQRKILVTGGAGLLAAHLAHALVDAGADVRLVSRRARPAWLCPAVEYQQADLLESAARMQVMCGIEMVFHLAAVGWGLHENLKQQAELLTANVLLNTMMLSSAQRAGIQRYLYASSSAVYPGDAEELDETAAWSGPPHASEFAFGWAKRIGEVQATAYHRYCGMRIAIVRPSNPYGPWDNFDPYTSHVIPALIRRAEAREVPFRVKGDGTAVRSFIYAADAARGMMLALEKGADCDPVNLASPEAVTIAELARTILELSGHDAPLEFDASGPNGHPRKVPNLRAAAEKLGLRDYIPLREGLRRTIKWYASAVT